MREERAIMSEAHGNLVFVLHAHLPYVRHPEHEIFLEENWFFEGIIETYLPLLSMFDRLNRDGVSWRITMTLSPTLVSMMEDPLLMRRFEERLDRLRELSRKEVDRTRGTAYENVTRYYRDHLDFLHRVYVEDLGKNLLGAFRRHMDSGSLEGITCGATHGFQPFQQEVSGSSEAQIRVGVSTFRRVFGRAPKGIWLPECAYYEGVDRILRHEGIRFFFMEAHGILYADPQPPAGVYAPLVTSEGLFAFGRDPESSKQVWSSKEGYPGDFAYRDFYRDIGYDLDYDYVRPYLHTDGPRGMTGLKYHRITGPTDQKEIYDPAWAREKVREHARDFVEKRKGQIQGLSNVLGLSPTIVCPYDAELFGHWWFEGVSFLEEVFREVSRQESVEVHTPAELVRKGIPASSGDPEPSSWGEKGYYEFWLNSTNDWIYPPLFEAAREMLRLTRSEGTYSGRDREILNQMGRELLLAQSSDWPFIMTTKTMVEYAVSRLKNHLHRFWVLREMLVGGRYQEDVFLEIQGKDSLFPDLDCSVFRPLSD
jgi:1,4-alpha-glucan branching enzyme